MASGDRRLGEEKRCDDGVEFTCCLYVFSLCFSIKGCYNQGHVKLVSETLNKRDLGGTVFRLDCLSHISNEC